MDDDAGEGTVIRSNAMPPGEYELSYVRHWTTSTQDGGKLNIEFAIVDGPEKGLCLEAHYRVHLNGPPGESGKFAVSELGHYYDQMTKLFPRRKRRDRLSPRMLKGKVVRGKVESVTKDWKGKKRAKPYSKVEQLIELVDYQIKP
jgi:hypothetical protein